MTTTADAYAALDATWAPAARGAVAAAPRRGPGLADECTLQDLLLDDCCGSALRACASTGVSPIASLAAEPLHGHECAVELQRVVSCMRAYKFAMLEAALRLVA